MDIVIKPGKHILFFYQNKSDQEFRSKESEKYGGKCAVMTRTWDWVDRNGYDTRRLYIIDPNEP